MRKVLLRSDDEVPEQTAVSVEMNLQSLLAGGDREVIDHLVRACSNEDHVLPEDVRSALLASGLIVSITKGRPRIHADVRAVVLSAVTITGNKVQLVSPIDPSR